MMSVQESFDAVAQSDDFKRWHDKNKSSFLCSLFKIKDQDKETGYQVDFYSKGSETISSFVIENGKAKLALEDAKVFKKDEDEVEELNLADIKVSEHDAIKNVEQIRKKKYAQEKFIKHIIILQHKKVPIWNISAITVSLNVLNAKIDAKTGKVIQESLQSLFSFRKDQEK